MRHGKRINHLGRTAPHRKAMLSNMATSLILQKRISTTVAKAKELRKYVEPLITKSKTDSTHSRRMVFSYLQNKESVKILFDEVSDKVSTRPGGYTRIIKTGNRLGDNAEMCIIELVDYNELMLTESAPKKAKSRRSRKGGKKAETEAKVQETEAAVEVKEDTIADAVVEEAQPEVEVQKEEKKTEENVEAKSEDVTEEAPTVEEKEAEEVKDVEAKDSSDEETPKKKNETSEKSPEDDAKKEDKKD